MLSIDWNILLWTCSNEESIWQGTIHYNILSLSLSSFMYSWCIIIIWLCSVWVGGWMCVEYSFTWPKTYECEAICGDPLSTFFMNNIERERERASLTLMKKYCILMMIIIIIMKMLSLSLLLLLFRILQRKHRECPSEASNNVIFLRCPSPFPPLNHMKNWEIVKLSTSTHFLFGETWNVVCFFFVNNTTSNYEHYMSDTCNE